MNSQTETSSLSAPSVSVARKCWSWQVSFGKEASGIHETSFQSTMNGDLDILENVGLLGGTTMFQGVDERMTMEFVAPAPSAMNSRSKECAEFPGVSLYHAEHVAPGSKPL